MSEEEKEIKYPVKRVCPKCGGWLKVQIVFHKGALQMFHTSDCEGCEYHHVQPYLRVRLEDYTMSEWHRMKTEFEHNHTGGTGK